MTLYIVNDVNYHYEILESIMIKHKDIIKNDAKIIYLKKPMDANFCNYIKQKYVSGSEKINTSFEFIIGTPKSYDYCIDCTKYSWDCKDIVMKDPKKYFFISHNVCSEYNQMNNVFYLTPLGSLKVSMIYPLMKKNEGYIKADILPFSDNKIKSDIPIYIIQGNIGCNLRRDHNLITMILNNKYKHDFKIKMIGRGKPDPKFEKYKDKLIIKPNLNFTDYHKEFLECYCILPLTTKKSKPQYYTNQLTSSINYAIGYNLKCILDRDLQDIYHLNNAEVFDKEEDIVKAFEKTLNDFFEAKNR